MSLPYPEPGLRLIRQDHIEQFNAQMQELRGELKESDQEGGRSVDLSPVGGRVLRGFRSRSQALAAEQVLHDGDRVSFTPVKIEGAF